jgi:GTP-binding protein
MIRSELVAYGADLEGKVELVALNKIDSLDRVLVASKTGALFEVCGQQPYPISAVSGEGVRELLRAAYRVTAKSGGESAEDRVEEQWRP